MNQFKQTQSNQNEDDKFDPTIAAGKGNIALILISALGAFFLLTALLIGLDSLGILPLDKFRLGNSKQSPSASVNFTKSDGQAVQDQPVSANGLTLSQPAKFAQSVDIAGDLTAPNILYSVIAGKGTSISAGQTPTVTNTGVLSFGGASGDIKTSTGLAMDANQTLTVANVPNSALTHSKVNVSAGSNLTGGGDVNLGDSITLSLTDSIALSTATFSGALGVGGEASISSKLIFNSQGNLGTLTWTPSNSRTVTVPDATGTVCLTTGNCSGIGGVVGGSGTQNYAAKWNAGGTTLGNSIIYDNGSNVGIGTTGPLVKLQVGANVNTMPTNTSLFLRGVGGGAQSSTIPDGRITLAVDTNADFGGYIANFNADGTGPGQFLQLGTRRSGGDLAGINIREGNVGIGTTGPGAPFNVYTTTPINGIISRFERNSANNVNQLDLVMNNGNGVMPNSNSFYLNTNTASDFGIRTTGSGAANFLIQSSGNVGIGTTAPGLRLDVQDSQSATAAAMVTNTNTSTNASGLVVKLGFTGTGASTNHFINFLDGNGRIQGSIQGNGANGVTYAQEGIADFAEYMKAASPSSLSAGTVVCQSDSGVVVCDQNSVSKVVGIRSDHPAFLGGVKGSNSVIVGFVGQVPVRIAPDSSSISSGDFLTVSATYPGMAQRSVNAGYTVAKALEGWSSGSSQTTILASINLGYSIGNPELAVIPVGSPSGSFTLPALNTSPAQALDLASVSAQFGQFSDTLKVIGKTQLGATTIGGKLTVGLITIDDLKADISAMNGLLSFQQGAVQIDGVGNITIAGTITARKINISEDNTASGSAVLNSSIGQAIIPAGQTRIGVGTTAVTSKSQVFTSLKTLIDEPLVITSLESGKLFVVEIAKPQGKDVNFGWWIVN